MKVVRYSGEEYILRQMSSCTWRAGMHLYQKLADGKCGDTVLCLMDGERLAGFCTYADMDEIQTDLRPWLGYVYVFPAFRGQRCMSMLVSEAIRMTPENALYVSSDEAGLYEKHGFRFLGKMKTVKGKTTSVYKLALHDRKYGIIGEQVTGVIDRPLGSRHPVHGFAYPLNYGYVGNVYAGDGEEQDVYVLGHDRPTETFAGTVVAVVHRLNDAEDKWVAAADEREYSDEEILQAVSFQERYFVHELYRR